MTFGSGVGLSEPDGEVGHGRQRGAAVSGVWGQTLEHLEGLPLVEAGSLSLFAHGRKPHPCLCPGPFAPSALGSFFRCSPC